MSWDAAYGRALCWHEVLVWQWTFASTCHLSVYPGVFVSCVEHLAVTEVVLFLCHSLNSAQIDMHIHVPFCTCMPAWHGVYVITQHPSISSCILVCDDLCVLWI